VATVESELNVSKETPASVMYTVVKGDTPWKIAEANDGKGKGTGKGKGKGKGKEYSCIFEANKPMLTHPDKIYPGQVLRIPSLG
jgi:nucleoid-associated protein YgaU